MANLREFWDENIRLQKRIEELQISLDKALKGAIMGQECGELRQ